MRPVQQLINTALRISHECKGLSKSQAEELRKAAYRAQAALNRKKEAKSK